MGDKPSAAGDKSDNSDDSDDSDDEMSVCKVCGAFLIDSEALSSHMLSKHPPANDEKKPPAAEEKKRPKMGPASRVKKVEVDSDSDDKASLPEPVRSKPGPLSKTRKVSGEKADASGADKKEERPAE